MRLGKVAGLLAITLAMTLVETAMVYFLRTKGPMPFKLKILPDFEL